MDDVLRCKEEVAAVFRERALDCEQMAAIPCHQYVQLLRITYSDNGTARVVCRFLYEYFTEACAPWVLLTYAEWATLFYFAADILETLEDEKASTDKARWEASYNKWRRFMEEKQDGADQENE